MAWIRAGVVLLVVTGLLWDGSSVTGGLAALPLWYFGAVLVTAVASLLGLELAGRASSQPLLWRQSLFKCGGYALIFVPVTAPHRALELVGSTGFEYAGRLIASLLLPAVAVAIFVGLSVLLDGRPE